MGVVSLAPVHGWGDAMMAGLRPAAIAFDAAAPTFDSRFASWQSVAAQRRAVRAELLRVFPKGKAGSLELGGGTGIDATFLAERGFEMLLTDPSPTMVELAKAKLVPLGSQAKIAAGEDMEEFAAKHLAEVGRNSMERFQNFRATELRCRPASCGAEDWLAC